jgi:hypothetical protein
MPPNFRSAREKGHGSNGAAATARASHADAAASGDASPPLARARAAAFVQHMFPEKFGGDTPQSAAHATPSHASPKPAADAATSSARANGRPSSAPPVPPVLGRPVPFVRRAVPRRAPGSAARHIQWARDLVRDVHKSVAIPRKSHKDYWFQETTQLAFRPEYCSVRVDAVCCVEIPRMTKIRLMAWERAEDAATVGRVTLYVAQLPPHPFPADERALTAAATLRPFGDAVPLDLALPAGAYMLQVRRANPAAAAAAARQRATDASPTVVLLLETVGTSFGLR